MSTPVNLDKDTFANVLLGHGFTEIRGMHGARCFRNKTHKIDNKIIYATIDHRAKEVFVENEDNWGTNNTDYLYKGYSIRALIDALAKHGFKEIMAKGGKVGDKKEYFKDKQSGEIVTEEEMLGMVDEDDQLDGFYSLGYFKSKKDVEKSLNKYEDGGEIRVNDISAELEKFDIDNLDAYESREYKRRLPSLGKVGSLQVIINDVEGDYTQLSPELAELAEKQISIKEWEKDSMRRMGYEDGGSIDEKIKVAFYHWGQYEEDREIDAVDLPVRKLTSDELDGFNIREEDENKSFYAEENDIDEDDDGVSVKRAYATVKEYAKGGSIKGKYEVELSAEPNPDYSNNRRDPRGKIKIKPSRVKVSSFAEASKICREFIDDNELGGGNWTGGAIYKDGKQIAHVSYNGRVWEGSNSGANGKKELFDEEENLITTKNKTTTMDQSTIDKLVAAANGTNATAKEIGTKKLKEAGLDTNGKPLKSEKAPAPVKTKSVAKAPEKTASKVTVSKASDEDCAELIEQHKKRKAQAKKRAAGPQKTEATKNKEKIEKVEDNLEARLKKGEVSKAEIKKMLVEARRLVKLLEKYS